MNSMSSDRRSYVLKARAERQRKTRDRIVAATEALHREVGPARTTVAEIARRAGVQRLTVYNTFPDPSLLFAACQQRFLRENPPPQPTLPEAGQDSLDCLAVTLRRLYRWYRTNQSMERHIHRDRLLIPELDTLLRKTADARSDVTATAFANALTMPRAIRNSARAFIRLSLDFRTWAMLVELGLSDQAIIALFIEGLRGLSRDERRRHSAPTVDQ
jgi:AcrR family transcriptional regulator